MADHVPTFEVGPVADVAGDVAEHPDPQDIRLCALRHTATLRMVANFIDLGMPAPIAVYLFDDKLFDDKPGVQVRVDDIGWWLTAMEIGEPTWHGAAGEYLSARWPEGTFDAHPFTLRCVSTAPAPMEVRS